MRLISNKISKILISSLWLVVSSYGLYYLLKLGKQTISGDFEWVFPEPTLGNMILLGALLFLMLVNWSIEAIKWKLSINDLEHQNFIKALRATLVGVSISTWMPNRLGEYIGKVFYVKQENRFKGAVSALYVSYTQILVTSLFGIIGGCYFVLNYSFSKIDAEYLVWITLMLLLLSTILIFKRKLIKLAVVRNKHVITFIRTLTRYSSRQTFKLIALSALRFTVFTSQFVIALYLFGLQINFLQGFLLVSLIYGIQTVVPASAIAGLGIRGALSVYFLGFVTQNQSAILTAAYFIWVINLLLPSVVGVLALITSPVRFEVKELALNYLKIKR